MTQTWVVDLYSGDMLWRVDPAEFEWESTILGTGEGKATFVLPDETELSPNQVAAAREVRHDRFRPNRRGLALVDAGTVVFFGKIENWDYSRNDASFTVKLVEFRSEMAWRLTYRPSAYTAGSLTITDRSASGAVRAILQRAMQWSGDQASVGYYYPIDLPPLDGSGPFSQTWEFWKKLRISDLLEQIEAEGYEVYFRPYVSTNQIRFETVVSERVEIGETRIILAAPNNPLHGVRYLYSGANEMTGLQGLGEGSGQDQPVASAQNAATPTSGVPARDGKVSLNGLTGSRLQSATNAVFRANRAPIAQLTVESFEVTDAWPAAHALPGRVWGVEVYRDPMIPAGVHDLRVIKASGGLPIETVKVEVQ